MKPPTYLFFDTETTGLPLSWRAAVSDVDNWPRLVQLAFLYHDAEGNELMAGNYIIKPEGFTIPASASAIHGISNERANAEGIALQEILRKFQQLAHEADFLVAHNMSFDEKIIGSELIRAGISNFIPAKKRICTMQRATDFCRIEGPYGYKWPKLTELYFRLFGNGFVEKHDAAVDIEATAKCFWELKRRGIIGI